MSELNTVTVPEPDAIKRMTLSEATDALATLREKGIAMLDNPDRTDEDLRNVSRMQKAAAAIGERVDLLANADKTLEDLREQRKEAEAKRGIHRAPESKDMANRPGNLAKTLGDSAEWKALADRWRASGDFGGSGTVEVDETAFFAQKAWMAEYKATLGTDDTLTDVDTEYTPRQERIPGVIEVLYDVNNIATLFPNIPHSSEDIRYMVETVNDEAAVETAEGALLAEASIEFAETTKPIRKIGATMPVTMEGLEQEAFIRGHVNQRLVQFVQNREDLQLLKGGGTGQDLEGILVVTGTQTQNVSLGGTPTGQDWAEAIHQAATKVAQAFLPATGVLSSADGWQTLRLAKDLDGQYLNAVITEAGIKRVWGLPLVMNENMDDVTGAVATDQPFAVVSRQAAGIHRRRGISVTFTDSHADYFARDTILFKATERIGLAVYRPAGIAIVTAVA